MNRAGWTMPPAWALESAVELGGQSPCAKSKRAVVVIWLGPDGQTPMEIGYGYNRPPYGIGCDGSPACRASCGARCLHAEGIALAVFQMSKTSAVDPADCELVHVKIDEYGQVTAGKGPCCVPCAIQVLDAGIGGVWLYQTAASIAQMVIRHRENLPAHVEQAARRVGPFAGVLEPSAPLWLRYEGRDFHRITMAECQVY